MSIILYCLIVVLVPFAHFLFFLSYQLISIVVVFFILYFACFAPDAGRGLIFLYSLSGAGLLLYGRGSRGYFFDVFVSFTLLILSILGDLKNH